MRTYREGGPFAGPRELYFLDPASVHVGDIVLSTEPFSMDSELIKLASGGEYSHAAICTDIGMLVEANTAGKRDGGAVGRINILRIAVTEPKYVRVLRLRRDTLERQKIARKAAVFAEWMISRKYWWDGVKKFIGSKIPSNEEGAFFCSHLVSEAYRLAGCDLLPGTEPEKTAPGAFVDSKVLHDVTTQALRIDSEDFLRKRLPNPDESLHLDIEVKSWQALLESPELKRIAKKHGEAPQSFIGLFT
jgi:hypothetical protein